MEFWRPKLPNLFVKERLLIPWRQHLSKEAAKCQFAKLHFYRFALQIGPRSDTKPGLKGTICYLELKEGEGEWEREWEEEAEEIQRKSRWKKRKGRQKTSSSFDKTICSRVQLWRNPLRSVGYELTPAISFSPRNCLFVCQHGGWFATATLSPSWRLFLDVSARCWIWF